MNAPSLELAFLIAEVFGKPLSDVFIFPPERRKQGGTK